MVGIRLKPRQQRAISALLETRSIVEASQSTNIGERTLRRWLNLPDFKAALSSAEERKIDGTARRLVGLSDKALDALESVLDTPGQDGAGNKRLAAVAILEALLKLRELRSVEQRLTALEKSFEVKK